MKTFHRPDEICWIVELSDILIIIIFSGLSSAVFHPGYRRVTGSGQTLNEFLSGPCNMLFTSRSKAHAPKTFLLWQTFLFQSPGSYCRCPGGSVLPAMHMVLGSSPSMLLETRGPWWRCWLQAGPSWWMHYLSQGRMRWCFWSGRY